MLVQKRKREKKTVYMSSIEGNTNKFRYIRFFSSFVYAVDLFHVFLYGWLYFDKLYNICHQKKLLLAKFDQMNNREKGCFETHILEMHHSLTLSLASYYFYVFFVLIAL